jgi:hypothetical protein
MLIVVLGILSACGLAGWLTAQGDSRAQLAAAEARWQARPFLSYRLVVETRVGCQLEVEVTDEQVVSVVRPSPCGTSGRTVKELFDVVKRNKPIVQECTFYNCVCRQEISVYASYDPQWGYPRRISVWLAREINWTKPDLWRYVWSFQRLPDCRRTADAQIVRVDSLLPLP